MTFIIAVLLVVVVIQLFCLLGRMQQIDQKLESNRNAENAADLRRKPLRQPGGPQKEPDQQPRPAAPVPAVRTEVKPPVSQPPPAPVKAPAAAAVKSEAKPEIKPAVKPPVRPEARPAAPPQPAGSFEFAPSWITDWIFVRGKYRTPGVSAEYAAATAWLIRVGVLILLFGIGFLAKYMIDHNMFPPALRVAGMAMLALVLFVIGLRMASTKYSSVALGIIGLSFAAGYLCVFTGSRLYGLIGVPWAYGAMVVLTAFCMTFSVRRDYLFPALVGVLGAYLTPFLLNSRTVDPQWQLGYLTVVTAGVLFCAFFRSWNFLNWLALAFGFLAQAVIIDWFRYPARQIIHFGFADTNFFQAFILLNFAFFALLPTLRVLVRREKLVLSDILLHCAAHVSLFLLTLFRFSSGTINSFTLRYVLIVAAVLSLAQLPLVRSADKVDRNWSVLQLIFAAGALLCLIPVEFSALWITAGWMILALILLALGIHLNSITLTVGAAAACAIAGWRILIRDLIMEGLFRSDAYLTGMESRMMGIGVFIAGLLLATGLIAYSKRKYPEVFERMPFLVPGAFCIASLGLLFIYSSLELYWMFDTVLPGFRNGGLSLWWGLWAILLLLSGILAKQNLTRRISLVLFGVCAVKIFLVDLESLHALYKVAAFVVLGLLMLGGAILYTRFKDRIFKV